MSRHVRKNRRRQRHRRLTDGQRAVLARKIKAFEKWLAGKEEWQWQ
jgi:hypothetical protein